MGGIEIPDWGYQMPADRVLREAASLGLAAVEAGPETLLSPDPTGVSETLDGYGLSLVGGFVPAVLHEPDVREEQLAFVQRRGEGPISDVRKSLDFVKGRLAGARAGERGADG